MVHLALEDGYQKLERVWGGDEPFSPRASRRRRDGLARSFVKERARERRDFGISGVQQLEKLAKQQLGQRQDQPQQQRPVATCTLLSAL